MTSPTYTRADFQTDQEVRWCPGCGDYTILASVQMFLADLGRPREEFVFVSGIGCSSRFPYYVNTYGMHSIHGRAPAIATGIATTRPDLSVWVITGDGDGLSIGGNHLIHALRRNVNLKIILFNNQIYGLTKGQYSPTSEVGKSTKSSPFGSLDYPFNPVSLALGAEATFVARTLDMDRGHTQEMLQKAYDHDGAKAVVMRGGQAEIVDSSSVDPKAILVHDETREDPSIAFALSRLSHGPYGPTPLGIFRNVDRPAYDREVNVQVAAAQEKLGDGDLDKLIRSHGTWTVGPGSPNGGSPDGSPNGSGGSQ
ncbi:MAG TPA: 2-oxoacid:ferredoxin oxidoreductase subunit beta [Acidimicrobiia bacterium]|nr:2-oxoacid:ferredoxin oxidoreductase subunit beta [Acidimicrobiia bacterium]